MSDGGTHIVDAHPLLNGRWESVQSTIMNPTGVYQDANDPDIECFYRLGAVADYRRYYLKVCVASDENMDTAFVVTAYLTPRIKGTEIQIWPNS